MAGNLKDWSWSRLLLLAASVFAVAGVTALTLTLAQNIPSIPLFSELFRPAPVVPQIALSDEEKLAILATLSNDRAATPETKKVAILNSLARKQTDDALTTEQKLEILNRLSVANPQ